MRKSLVIAEQDNIAALLENDRVVEFFVNRGELLLGDIYTATVENILPGIDAAFVNLGKDKMGFLHANDVPGQGPLKERLVPKQKLLVQITKEPTGHKGPRVSTAISLPGRFLVLVPEERGVSISRRISDARERARLKSVVNLLKPPGVGLIIRTEAKGQGEPELFEDFEQLWDHWQTIVSDAEASIGPKLIYRDQDLLYRVIRDAYSTDIVEIIVDTVDGQRRAQEFLAGWTARSTQVIFHTGDEPVLVARNIDREIESALSERVDLPSGGHLNIQPTEALTVIDVNSGRFTSSRTQAETVRRTNLEAAQEIPRQLRLRNVGGMVIVDFIDMDSRKDQQQVLEAFQRCLEDDRAKPQIGQLSDLGLVELTRRRQGQSLRELFTTHCPTCTGLGVVPTLELGTTENKRVLNMKSREEEVAIRGRGQIRSGMHPQGTTLRAATVSSGRVQSTLVEISPAVPGSDESFADVPEEILEQVPDDLLEHISGKSDFTDSDFAPARRALTIDLEEAEGDEVFSEACSSEALVEAETAFGQSSEGYVHAVNQDFAREPVDLDELPGQLGQASSSWEPPFTPYEAEPEQIAGVFRLKAKAAGPQLGELEAFELPEESVGAGGALVSEPTETTDTQPKAPDTLKPMWANGQETGQPDTLATEPKDSGVSWWASSQQLDLPLVVVSNESEGRGEESPVSASLPGSSSYTRETDSASGENDSDKE